MSKETLEGTVTMVDPQAELSYRNKSGTYTAAVFKVQSDGGNEKRFQITRKILDKSDNADLKKSVDSLKPNDRIKLTIDKVERGGKTYNNVAEIEKLAAAPANQGGGGGRNIDDRTIGMQIGNALTNSVHLVTSRDDYSKLSEADKHSLIEESMKSLLVASLRVKELVESGELEEEAGGDEEEEELGEPEDDEGGF